MNQAGALKALDQRTVVGPVLGGMFQAVVLAAVALGVTRLLDIDLPFWMLLVMAAPVALVLEVSVQRARAKWLAEIRPLFRALIEAVGEAAKPRVTWARGLPRLEAEGEHPFAVHLEPTRSRMRIGLTVLAEPAATMWLASRQPEDFPHRLERRLAGRITRLAADDTTLCALARDPETAMGVLARSGTELRALLAADAPYAASLEVGHEDVRWDVALHPGVTVNRLMSLVNRLPALVATENPPEEGGAAH